MKKMRNGMALVLIISAAFIHQVYAQGSLEDYRRADRLESKIKSLVINSPVRPQWIHKTSTFWYLNLVKGQKHFLLYDCQKQRRKPAFNQQKLAAGLNALLKKHYSPYDLPFREIKFSQNSKTIEFVIDQVLYSCNLKNYKIRRLKKVKKGGWDYDWQPWWYKDSQKRDTPQDSPDKKWQAYIKSYNLFVREVDTGKEYQLSHDGTKDHYYSALIKWSPDSARILVNQVRVGASRYVSYVESSPEDQLQPKYEKMFYPKPGDIIHTRKPRLFHLQGKKEILVPDTLFNNPFSTGEFRWEKDSGSFTFEYNQRGHQVYRVIRVNATDGTAKSVIDEKSSTFFDYAGKKYRYDFPEDREIIWMSERDGYNHLYLYDSFKGRAKHQITRGEWVVRKVLYVDKKGRTITFLASGNNKAEDPYHLHCYRVQVNGSGLQCLTPEAGHHQVYFSPDKKYFIDTYSTADQPAISLLRRGSDGRVIKFIQQVDISGLDTIGWKKPIIFSAKGRDNITDIWGLIYRPTNFDPAKKYPVIEYIYAGPHDSFVPKSFRPYRSLQSLAEIGFIVVQVDGMGTSNRSKAFHDVCWKNLKDAGFQDRIQWIKAAARKFPCMDITEVGIYGTSAGGQSAAGALLFHPEFYKVAVSSCGCHDNRMDKIWWNELWMGYPVGPHYAASSNVDNAHRLKGKLLLILGEMDKNVDPSSTMQVVNALIKSKKDFDFLYFPGMGHSSGGRYGERRRRDFFIRHLLKKDPPDWNRLKNE